MCGCGAVGYVATSRQKRGGPGPCGPPCSYAPGIVFKLKIVACTQEESKSGAVRKFRYMRSKSASVTRVINAALKYMTLLNKCRTSVLNKINKRHSIYSGQI